MDVGAQDRLVCGRAGDDHLDGAPGRIVVVPAGAQGDDLLVQPGADLAAHGHDHALAGAGGGARLEMAHDVLGHFLEAWPGAHQLFQLRPAALGRLACGDILFVLEDLLHLGVEGLDICLVDIQPGQAAFVVDGYRGAILHGVLDVVDAHVVPEDCPGVLVLTLNGSAGKTDESGIGQGIAQMLGEAILIASGLLVQHGAEAVLGAVGLVGDHHDVGALGELGKARLPPLGLELLHGGEDDAAGGPVLQQFAEMVPPLCLQRRLPQQGAGTLEGLEELAVQVVAVGDHHHGGVLHLGLLHELGGEEHHGQALARALGVPHQATAARARRHAAGIVGAGPVFHLVAGRGGRHQRGAHCLAHGMELVVGGDFLNDAPLILLEEHEIAQVVQQEMMGEEATHHLLQLEFQQGLVVFVVDGAPGQEALPRRGERAHPRMGAVGDHQCLVGHEQGLDLGLVGLQLVEGPPDVRLLIGRVLQLQHCNGQAVDEAHQVGAPGLLGALHRELVDHQEAVALRALEIHQPHPVAALAPGLVHLHRHAIHQPFVEGAVAEKQRGVRCLGDMVHHFVERGCGDGGVQNPQGLLQPAGQDDLAVILALRRLAIRGNVRPEAGLPAALLEPAKGELFQVIFADHEASVPSFRMARYWP